MDIVGLLFLLASGAAVAYGVAMILKQIKWDKLKNLVRKVAKKITDKVTHIMATVFANKIAQGFFATLFGIKGLVFYRMVVIWDKAKKIVYNEEKEEFKSLSEIADEAIREYVETAGEWAIESAIESAD